MDGKCNLQKLILLHNITIRFFLEMGGIVKSICIFLLFSFSVASFAQGLLTGKVIRVKDGDSFVLMLSDSSTQDVRMYGIDAPEIRGGQPYCKASKKFLADMIAGRQVSVKINGKDRYRRTIGIVSTNEIPDVNLVMIRSGMAWHYSYFDKTKEYADAQTYAKSLRLGLWKGQNPVNPYEWRKSHKKKR